MKKETFGFMSSNQTNTINAIRWTPDEEPKAIVQLVHGMAEYIDRYDDFARFLNEHNILVVGHDHLGHGDSVLSSDDYGYFSEGDATQFLIDDVLKLTTMTKEAYPGVPYYVFGHSMGSFITRHYISKYSDHIDGVIICGTGQMPKLQLRAGRIAASLLAKIRGWKYRSKIIDQLGFGGFNKSFENPRTSSDWISRDPVEVDKYINDDRNGFMFTLNGYYHLFSTCLKTQDQELLENIRKDLPILMIAGDHDPVGDFGKAVVKVSEQYKDIGIKDVTTILYPEYRHEILNEIDKEVVYEDVYDWITSHLEKL